MSDIVERLKSQSILDVWHPMMLEAADEIERQRKVISATIEDIQYLKDKQIEAAAEIEKLRAALANSELPCVYCSLPKDEWSKCESGFPGCDRADDAMGCPEVGARLEADDLRAENEKLRAALKAVCLGVISERESIDCAVIEGAALRAAATALKEADE